MYLDLNRVLWNLVVSGKQPLEAMSISQFPHITTEGVPMTLAEIKKEITGYDDFLREIDKTCTSNQKTLSKFNRVGCVTCKTVYLECDGCVDCENKRLVSLDKVSEEDAGTVLKDLHYAVIELDGNWDKYFK